MTVDNLAKALGVDIVCGEKSLQREISCGYACDLLSLVMGRGPENSVWMTVMGNVNAVAVASLADISAILVCEGVVPDDEAVKKATEQDIAILKTDKPIYEMCVSVSKLL